MRYFVEIAYLGTNYHGWQVQPNATTVQGELDFVLSKLLRQEINTIGSGRTDTGVHCAQQYAQFDHPDDLNGKNILHRINSFLPNDIAVKSLWEVKEDAHARFDATKRSYRYDICLEKSPFKQGLVWQYFRKPDFDKLQEAAKVLLEFEDFTAFSKMHADVNTHICDIMSTHWTKEGNNLSFHITANRFLRGMIRIIVGNMMEVGMGRMTVDYMRETLALKDRKRAAKHLAPGQGLFLSEVIYPEETFVREIRD
ncbi:tRNA pseudouridine(38-40) synthase TruA [Flammeovirga yaeyamensis]|uniref:tRNA pseudouridine synthase A n=1 Tax=Flammeovirga yaeyamensis TaxID=367791 RepID=A0AAX1N6H3_9BACT|nr:tRNA pseudouridine(38-40) synthase TruA [Flammeovirga yaeyamensis]MBB3698148.1 tRNA pseudouridine38-40 synthase [Flammeovirga yaeyamensis]NMF34495.1 tRNA pseudouridine(38-40) synthase TruA [Flammeovirga yaeyamensis]QWG01473.1 tRNA pseudouridine(38-40) synthase TruA [Flammeovirga yaeyamensis]